MPRELMDVIVDLPDDINTEDDGEPEIVNHIDDIYEHDALLTINMKFEIYTN